MNRRRVFALTGVVLAIVLAFFPYSTKKRISGTGEITELNKEGTSDCNISIEIREVRSLLFCYNRQFSYTLDGENAKKFQKLQDLEFFSPSHCETDDGLCMISQIYYRAQDNNVGSCVLVYLRDLSYAIITIDKNEAEIIVNG